MNSEEVTELIFAGHTIEVMHLIKETPGITVRDTILKPGKIGERTRWVRIQGLTEAGLVMEKDKENGEKTLYLTEAGKEIYQAIDHLMRTIKDNSEVRE